VWKTPFCNSGHKLWAIIGNSLKYIHWFKSGLFSLCGFNSLNWFLLLEDSARNNKQEINQFLQYVKERFSEVLLSAEVVTKSDFLGKGTCVNKIFSSYVKPIW